MIAEQGRRERIGPEGLLAPEGKPVHRGPVERRHGLPGRTLAASTRPAASTSGSSSAAEPPDPLVDQCDNLLDRRPRAEASPARVRERSICRHRFARPWLVAAAQSDDSNGPSIDSNRTHNEIVVLDAPERGGIIRERLTKASLASGRWQRGR